MIRKCSALGAVALGLDASEGAMRSGGGHNWRYCLNTSTIRGQKLPLLEIIDIAAQAGYDGIEPWIEEIEAHVRSGGSLEQLRQSIVDHGLTVESAIGFAEWIVDDEVRRNKALAQAKREMEMVAAIGGKRIAAPPAGAVDRSDLAPEAIAERYRALLEVGDQTGVVPQIEIWGFSKTLHTLGAAAEAAIESAHPKACILADVYHLYKGGSNITGLGLLNARALQVLHINDYPAQPPRDTIDDSHRVYPGDGVAPLKELFAILRAIGFSGALSLELFNPTYWKQDALTVARVGLQKLKSVAAL
ncbi:MAG: sugar phosphate isomerase/epimerase family protein [Chthonomonadales bacterium]